jgi:hypothetical protein
MKKLLLSLIPDALMYLGGASVATGVGMIYLPAGFIVGGAFLMASGVLCARVAAK